MYLHFFNLKEEPFSMTPDPHFFFMSKQHEDAIESLVYGVKEGKGFMTLTGEVGTGKSTLCRKLIQRLKEDVDFAVILNPVLSVVGLLKAINRDFGRDVLSETVEGQLDRLNDFLAARVQSGKRAVILIDEAQNLSIDALEMLRLLSNLETDKKKLLQILLVGQPELEKTLEDHRLRQLAQRIHIRHQVGPLNLNETREYIFHRLMRAGAEGQVGFNKSAIKKVYRYSKGFPRVVNILCDRTLLAAYSHRSRTIGKEVVNEAIKDVSGNGFKPWWRKIF